MAGKTLEEELQEVADFAALKGAGKAATRLELLQSTGSVVQGFVVAPCPKRGRSHDARATSKRSTSL